jgi:hypothetical protein
MNSNKPQQFEIGDLIKENGNNNKLSFFYGRIVKIKSIRLINKKSQEYMIGLESYDNIHKRTVLVEVNSKNFRLATENEIKIETIKKLF